MNQNKLVYFCKNCGIDSPKWLGKCPSCKQWNTFVEEVVPSKKTERISDKQNRSGIYKMDDIPIMNTQRLKSKDKELNQVLGGGFVTGSLVLLGGEPGIGKSTFALQIALDLQLKVVYVSGEENPEQIKLRCQRIGVSSKNCWLLNETNLENIINHLNKIKPKIIVIDSIQTISTSSLESASGNISQIKECTTLFLKYAKKNKITFILIGHITKDGQLAGPKLLEHIVDVVLYLEGDDKHLFRILRATKNRYGSTAEIGMYQMKVNGLLPIQDISYLLLSKRKTKVSGITLATAMEGKRTFMIEVQALVSSTIYGNPQRSTTGIHYKRLNMLLAVIENRLGYKFATKDVFLNIAGGIDVKDIAIDLAVIVAIISSHLNIIITEEVSFVGEVSLSGDIRPASQLDFRIKEAYKNGISKIFVPYSSAISSMNKKIEIIYVEKLKDVFQHLLKK